MLVAISLAGVLIRLYFTSRHRGGPNPWLAATGVAILGAVFVALMPRAPTGTAGRATFAQVRAIVAERCAGCHAESPTFAGFASAPKNVMLDTADRIVAQAQSIHQQTVVLKAMPIGNLTRMTDGERAAIDAWFRGGAKAD